MSLYVVESLSFENRRTKQVAFDSFSTLENLFKYLDSRNLNSVEIVVEDITENLIKETLTYLDDKELSIGFLCKHISNKNLINKYNIYLCKNYAIKNKRVKVLKKSVTINKGARFKSASIDKITSFDVAPTGKAPSAIDLEESFRQKLFKYLNKSKKTNVEVYTKGGITRKLFSKIVSEDGYTPKKSTILCLIIGMELDIDDALDLLNAAGYTLSNSIRLDKIVKAYVEIREFDINKINEELEHFNEPLLGWKPRED